MPSRVAPLIVASVIFACGSHASAQHFGKNKVEYVDFDFRILQTEHFAVYHYPTEEEGARIVSRLAERWYARLSRVLGHELDSRQPLILYGSQPEFAQTNVVNGFLGEGIGGVTESARRRIVMPFAPSLAETDRILGHEIVHAFQFDMARRYRGGLTWPLWTIEGLAQYLALGARSDETALWLRDAVEHDLLPRRHNEAERKFSPYRYGHALWAYLAGRYGDAVIPTILKARDAGSLPRRIKAITGLELDAVFDDWRKAAHAAYGAPPDRSHAHPTSRLISGESRGRLYLGPSVSPDGRHVVFFSERDRVSLDLFLAETATGQVVRKLATTAASARFESLQAIRSSGSWSSDGRHFVFAAIERGKPALIVLDPRVPGRQRTIVLPQFGQVLSPAFSPDGGAIAFSALTGGLTDIYVYRLDGGQLDQITDDAFADLHADWSPDGGRLAFVTDRFSTDLSVLRFGQTELALVDLSSRAVRRIPAIAHTRHINPQWSADGRSLYFVASPAGVANVHRIELDSLEVRQITDVTGGVGGLTPTSPALSVARDAHVLATSVYRNGQYEIRLQRGASALAGILSDQSAPSDDRALPPFDRVDGEVEDLLDGGSPSLPEPGEIQARAYTPDMFLEAIGPPHLSTGGGPFGTFFRGGGSFLFSDLLGERKLAVFAQAGNRLRDLALRVQFLNRERRWNWGAVAEIEPSLRRLPRVTSDTRADAPTFTRETHYFERTHVRVAGLLAYPLDRSQRLEFEAGALHSAYRRHVSAIVRSMSDGRIIDRSMTGGADGSASTVAEASAAYVRDTAVFGPTSPILGARSRFEIASTFGELSATRLLLDHRRYIMPVRPYTLAFRVLHVGQYGPDADDPRLLPTFLGSRYFLRGYGWGAIRCRANVNGDCAGYDELLGSRLLVGNVEVRVPLMGLASRDLHYGSVPAEGFVFADTGVVWSRAPEFSSASGSRRVVRSVGLGVRVNAFGFPFEWAAVRATDPPAPGWSFGVSFRPAF